MGVDLECKNFEKPGFGLNWGLWGLPIFCKLALIVLRCLGEETKWKLGHNLFITPQPSYSLCCFHPFYHLQEVVVDRVQGTQALLWWVTLLQTRWKTIFSTLYVDRPAQCNITLVLERAMLYYPAGGYSGLVGKMGVGNEKHRKPGEQKKGILGNWLFGEGCNFKDALMKNIAQCSPLSNPIQQSPAAPS